MEKKHPETSEVEVAAADVERGGTLDDARSSPEVMYIDPKLERRVVRKLDRRLLTLVCSLAVLAYIDRGNLGNARIAGMDVDLQLFGDRFDWLSTIFFIPFVIFHVQVIMWKKWRHDYMTAFTVLLWGLSSTLQAAVRNWETEMAFRFFLGVAESIFSTGMMYLFTFYYRRNELGLRCALYLSSAPFSSSFAGALAYAITAGKFSIANWRVLFLVEGIPSILMAPVALYFLPRGPDQATFFTPEEKEVAVARLKGQVGHSDRIGSIAWSELWATLYDMNAWLPTVMSFTSACCWGSLPIFLPTMIKSMGFTAATSQGLTAPPYLFAAFFTVTVSWYSDKYQQRAIAVVSSALLASVGYALLSACESIWLRYFGMFLAAGGLFSGSSNLSPWVMNNQGSDSRRGFTMVLVGVIGLSGTVLGSRIYPLADGPRYVKGNTLCASLMVTQCILGTIYRWLLTRENRKLDKLYGTLVERQLQSNLGENQRIAGEEDYGPNFRYVL
ncbi:hypothetical protein FQN49_006425 [Arthroderma sp. PD_2]|nr:hypothetical protein FQN49_006425 [Arthroderma sp. PD_2]